MKVRAANAVVSARGSVPVPTSRQETPGRSPRSTRDRLRRAVLTAINIAGFFLLWEWAVSVSGISPIFLPPPTTILKAGAEMVGRGQLWGHLSYSATNFAIGFVLAAVAGTVLGLLMGASRSVEYLLGPYVWALYATPRIALLPLLILWLGFGAESKILLIFLSAVMPVLITSMDGVKTVDQSLLRAAKVFGASRTQIYTRVVLPFTLPFIMTGLRQGVGRGLIAMVVAEMFGSGRGVGFMIARSAAQLDAAAMFALLIVLVVISVGLVYLMTALERWVAPWREDVRV
ncbi:MAG TPA: ABC transporter permease [bacterium]|nr:ABC transporter permease [bacterium]